MIALDATLEVIGPGGQRSVPFADLHRDPGETPEVETNLRPGEFITSVFVPSGPWTKRSLYLKVRDRESYEFGLVSVAVAMELEREVVKSIRLALEGR